MVPGVIRATYCRDSGGMPTQACRCDLRGDRCAVGYFVQGTEPNTPCRAHVLREYDTAHEQLADANTLPENKKTVGMLQKSSARNFPSTVYVADQNYFLK